MLHRNCLLHYYCSKTEAQLSYFVITEQVLCVAIWKKKLTKLNTK